MAASNTRVDQFLRQNKDYVDTDDQGNPVEFEQSVGNDGTVTFSFVNDGERVTYEARPGRPVRPTLAYQGYQLKKGRRSNPQTKTPATGANGGPKERERKPVQEPVEPSQPTQNSTSQPTANNQVETDDQATYFEQYIRLARKLIEG